ncbi:MAG: hypothetical protein JO273_07255 [Methylobacteriaceae bacterium]|nr:hypothetical protein [Methylobacteriaceae bacterium]MBV9633640.1 hypothetical protein [Methylobacteriaceae bacterium]
MAFRSRSGFFGLKQPRQLTFLVSLVLAVLGVLSTRMHIQYVSGHGFWFVVAGYVVLALGTLIDAL